MTELNEEDAKQALIDSLARALEAERRRSTDLELVNAELHARVVEFEASPTVIPPSEADTGKIRTGIDALADYVAAVDHLTGAVKGLEAEFANLPSIVKLAAAAGAADAVIALVTRVEALEDYRRRAEFSCHDCERRVGMGGK